EVLGDQLRDLVLEALAAVIGVGEVVRVGADPQYRAVVDFARGRLSRHRRLARHRQGEQDQAGAGKPRAKPEGHPWLSFQSLKTGSSSAGKRFGRPRPTASSARAFR